MNTNTFDISTMSPEQKSALIAQLYNSPEVFEEIENQKKAVKEQHKNDIERQIKDLREEIDNEIEHRAQSKKHQKELEIRINKLKEQISSKSYTAFVNPNNPNEVYRTGQYKPWMKELAKQEGIDVHDEAAMKQWVRKNSH